jgi:hypothetical protein
MPPFGDKLRYLAGRALVAARLATMRQGERTDLLSIDRKLSRDNTASMLNVGIASVNRAADALDSGPRVETRPAPALARVAAPQAPAAPEPAPPARPRFEHTYRA